MQHFINIFGNCSSAGCQKLIPVILFVVAALCWHLLYILTRVKLSSWLRRLLYPSGVPDDPEAHQKANKTVAAAAVLVVSMICIAVVVSFPCTTA